MTDTTDKWQPIETAPQKTHDGLPIIPGRPEQQPVRPADGAIAQCGVCGLRILPVMGYVCNNPRCGVFPQVTCSTKGLTP
jgi:hypothetical protein